jgi:hypothetical protein
MVRVLARTSLLLAVVLGLAAPASAQVVQSVHFGFGAFVPKGFDSRVSGDVLVEDLTTFNPQLFRIGDFKSGQVLGEWNLAFGHHIEVGAGVGYYKRTVPSIYADLVNDNGQEIEQRLGLRIIPATVLVRFLPFGKEWQVQPYLGVGASALAFRYTESGQFVDGSDASIFQARYVATGTAFGPVVLAGVRLPIRGDIYAVTLEARHQFGSGNTGGIDKGFLNDKIDLGGTNVTFGFLVRF